MTRSHAVPYIEPHGVTNRMTDPIVGSIQMYSLNEALARERIADAVRVAEHDRLVSRVRSIRRSRRLERMARQARSRAEAVSSVDYDLAS